MSASRSSNSPVVRERTLRQAQRRKRRVIWGLVIIVLLGAVVAGKQGYHWVKLRRAEQFGAAGDALVKTGNLKEAATNYGAALHLNPSGYRGLIGAARLASKADRAEAVDLWERVLKLPRATTSDRQEYIELLLRTGRLSLVQKVLNPLVKPEADVRTLLLASRYAAQTGDNARAIEFSRMAVKRIPKDGEAAYQLASVLALSTDPSQQAEARTILWKLGDEPGPYREAAVQGLARAPDLTDAEKNRVFQMLESLTPPHIENALLAADLRLQLNPDETDNIYEQTIAHWNQGQPAELIQLTRWLNMHQQPDRVLALATVDRAFKDNDLLLARLDALALKQRWEDIDSLLAQPDLRLDPSMLECFRARVAQERNAVIDAEMHWNRALSFAARTPSKLRFIASFAEQSHASATALKAFDQLAKFPDHSAFAYRGLERLSGRSKDLAVQRGAAERIKNLTGDNPNAAAQLAYVDLLAGKDVETNTALARKLVQEHSDRIAFRVTAALGFLRQHDPGQALEQFKGPAGAPPIDWSKTPPNWRAVYAAVLVANEQANAAHEIIRTIPVDQLSPEERALIGVK